MGANTNSNIISFRAKEYRVYTHVHFRCGIITPDALRIMKPPAVNFGKGVVISGRGPIWLYCALVHEYHPAAFVAVYEPRADGSIVVQSHSPNFQVGDVLPRKRYEKGGAIIWENVERGR